MTIDDRLAAVVGGARAAARARGGGARVEVAGRLVGEDDGRPRGQGAGDGDALLLAAGELRRAVAGAVGEPDACRAAAAIRAPLRRAAREAQRQRDVLGGRERRQQVEGLEDEADAVAAQPGELGVVEARRASTPSMATLPEVGVSRPAMMCMSVDLPEPDGPMTATKSPALQRDGHSAQRVDGGVAAAVTPGDVTGSGDRDGVVGPGGIGGGGDGERGHAVLLESGG